MWWGGLKGGLAIAVVLSIPSDLPERQFLFDLTIGMVLFTLLVSAPTIRPLMERLGMNRLSRGEQLELHSALVDARSQAHAFLSKLKRSKLTPEKETTPLTNEIRLAFAMGWYDEDAEKHDDDEFIATLRAYHIERKELKNLYESGYISQYIYLDMFNRLYDLRETLRLGESNLDGHRESNQYSFFQRLENNILRKIRERRWSSTLLSKYQSMRMVQQLQRDLAHVLMCDSVLAMLKSQDDLDTEIRDRVVSIYKKRKKYYRSHLKQVQLRFPGFYYHFLELLAKRAIIKSGWNHAKTDFEHGDLSAKGFVSIQHKVLDKLTHFEDLAPHITSEEDSVSDILKGLQIFDELSIEDRNYLEKSATCITFLPGDTIIGAYESGDSFYVIINGSAVVWRTDALSYKHRVADLGDGDIMGESSLLADYESGRHVRSATIKAETPCTVLRVSMRSMLAILKKYPEIKNAIQKIHDERGADAAPQVTDA